MSARVILSPHGDLDAPQLRGYAPVFITGGKSTVGV